MVASVAVRDEPEWALRGQLDGERAIARRMPGTRAENLAADYFPAEGSRELTEVEKLIVASVSQFAYDLSVHLENPSSCPRRRYSASGFLLPIRVIGSLLHASFSGSGS